MIKWRVSKDIVDDTGMPSIRMKRRLDVTIAIKILKEEYYIDFDGIIEDQKIFVPKVGYVPLEDFLTCLEYGNLDGKND